MQFISGERCDLIQVPPTLERFLKFSKISFRNLLLFKFRERSAVHFWIQMNFLLNNLKISFILEILLLFEILWKKCSSFLEIDVISSQVPPPLERFLKFSKIFFRYFIAFWNFVKKVQFISGERCDLIQEPPTLERFLKIFQIFF